MIFNMQLLGFPGKINKAAPGKWGDLFQLAQVMGEGNPGFDDGGVGQDITQSARQADGGKTEEKDLLPGGELQQGRGIGAAFLKGGPGFGIKAQYRFFVQAVDCVLYLLLSGEQMNRTLPPFQGSSLISSRAIRRSNPGRATACRLVPHFLCRVIDRPGPLLPASCKP